jgi:hypothetical protein
LNKSSRFEMKQEKKVMDEEDYYREAEHERLHSYSLADDTPIKSKKGSKNDTSLEDYGDWTDRIWKEYQKKHYSIPKPPSTSAPEYDFIFESTQLDQSAAKDRLSKPRSRYHEKWLKLQERLADKESTKLLKFKDLPIPSLSSPPTKDSVREFLLSGVESESRRREIAKVRSHTYLFTTSHSFSYGIQIDGAQG